MNQEYRARVLRNLPTPFLCAKCGDEIKEAIFSEDDLLCPLCELCLLKGEVVRMNVKVSEEERQMILLALAELSLRRPGWLDALKRVAGTFDGREMFNGFRASSADMIVAVK